MKGFGSRLKSVREQRGLKQSDLAKLIGLKSSAPISNWEKEINRPDLDKIPLLCEALDITVSYLLDYYGSDEYNITPAEQQHIKKYRALDKHGKTTVDFILDEETKRIVREKAKSRQSNIVSMKPRPKTIQIPHYWGDVSAGLGNYLDDGSSQYDMLELSENKVPYGTDYALTVSGDSMEPDIPDGATIFVEERIEIPEDEIGVFLYDNDSLCKRLIVDRKRRRIVLRSENESYKDIIINPDSDFRTLGHVLGYMDESGNTVEL